MSKRVTREEIFDEGRLVIRSFNDGTHVGLRVYDMKAFSSHGDPRRIKTNYEVQEMSDRKARAGLETTGAKGPVPREHSKKMAKENWALAREWMTKRWTSGQG